MKFSYCSCIEGSVSHPAGRGGPPGRVVEHDPQELNHAGGEEPEDLSGRVEGSRSAPLFPLMGDGASFWTLGTAEYGFLRRTLAPRPVTGLTTRQGRAAHCSAPPNQLHFSLFVAFPQKRISLFSNPGSSF